MRNCFQAPHPYLVRHLNRLPHRGLALDATLGFGGNASLLIRHGLQVIGVDIAEVAAHHAKACLPNLMAVIGDLTRFDLPAEKFDVIVNFYYLRRSLWPQYIRALKPRGILVFETFTQDMLCQDPAIDPNCLLIPNELRSNFSASLEIIEYQEHWVPGERLKSLASLVARKPAA